MLSQHLIKLGASGRVAAHTGPAVHPSAQGQGHEERLRSLHRAWPRRSIAAKASPSHGHRWDTLGQAGPSPASRPPTAAPISAGGNSMRRLKLRGILETYTDRAVEDP